MTTWTPEEQREHRKLWVEALRSGKYQQAHYVLRSPTGAMCCLGVACEIRGLTTWSEHTTDDGEDEGFQAVINGDAESHHYPPDEVVAWLGLASQQGKYAGGPSDGLAERNDDGKTFAEIADIIEAEPEGLIANPAA